MIMIYKGNGFINLMCNYVIPSMRTVLVIILVLVFGDVVIGNRTSVDPLGIVVEVHDIGVTKYGRLISRVKTSSGREFLVSYSTLKVNEEVVLKSEISTLFGIRKQPYVCNKDWCFHTQ